MTHQFKSWDDYFIPGTNTLRNLLRGPRKYGIEDPKELEARELALTWVRVVELAMHPVHGQFDYNHFKQVHRRIFQDVYAWAGQVRVGPPTQMTKSGPDVINYSLGDPNAPQRVYAYYQAGLEMEKAAQRQFADLGSLLADPGDDAHFITEIAEIWAELNVAHTFREGNTRTQIVFFSQVFEQLGFTLNMADISPHGSFREEFVASRFYSQATASSSKLAGVLLNVTSRPEPTTEQKLKLHRRVVPKDPPGF